MDARNLETRSDPPVRRRHGTLVVYHDPSALHVGVIDSLLDDPDRLFASGEVVRSPWQSAATDKTIVESGGRSYFLKRYNCLGGGYRLKNIFRISRALKSWRAGWKFLELGLPTPRPIACVEERRLRLLGRSYLLFEMLDGAHCLLDFWSDLSAERRREVLSLLGAEIGMMHRLGLLHGDLNWRNILVRRACGAPETYLVDLDGCCFVGSVTRERAERDMSHFFRDLQRNNASEEEAKFFVDAWEQAFC
jgi:tRNA A-37 threonylcarbamoyl transferase component Bud32